MKWYLASQFTRFIINNTNYINSKILSSICHFCPEQVKENNLKNAEEIFLPIQLEALHLTGNSGRLEKITPLHLVTVIFVKSGIIKK